MDNGRIREIEEENYKVRERIEKEYGQNPLSQYSTSELKAEIRRRKGR